MAFAENFVAAKQIYIMFIIWRACLVTSSCLSPLQRFPSFVWILLVFWILCFSLTFCMTSDDDGHTKYYGKHGKLKEFTEETENSAKETSCGSYSSAKLRSMYSWLKADSDVAFLLQFKQQMMSPLCDDQIDWRQRLKGWFQSAHLASMRNFAVSHI